MKVTALAMSRADRDPSYTRLDLTDTAAVDAFFEQEFDVVVHCAAERRPDVAEAVSVLRLTGPFVSSDFLF